FVYPNKGPVGANYGLDECRFLKPLYHNDTVQVRLTCKQKVDRDSRGKEHPSGVVKWFVEVFDQDRELCATATVLTLVQKKSPFAEFSRDHLVAAMDQLTENHKAAWGVMTPQHMVEHLEWGFKVATGELEVEVTTPENRLEKYQDSLWNYIAMPRNFNNPMYEPEVLRDLEHGSLKDAKEALINAYDAFETYYKTNPEAAHANAVFGALDKEHWDLLNRKHFHHHFEQFGLL
ncbi:MAG: phenylacetic acid degradation bifunctional protein PaaZ, partial [Bacteroidota bacterium]